MSAAITAAVVGTVGGAMISSNAQRSAANKAAAAAQWNPIGLNTLGGGETRFANGSYENRNSPYSPIFNQFQGMVLPTIGQQGQVAADARSTGASGVMQGFQNLQALPDYNPADFQNYVQATQGYQNMAGPGNVLSAANGLISGNSPYGQAGQYLMGQGAQALNKNYDQLAADRLSTLRAAAQPGESLAMNKFKQNLFNRGTLNDNTGSSILAQGFAKGLAEADLSRVINSQDFAQNQLNQERQYGTNLFGLGANTMAQGQSLGGNLYNSGLSGAQFGAQTAQNLFGTQTGFNDMNYTRGQTRLSDAASLFGFGQGIQDSNLNQTNNQIQTMLGLSANERSDFATAGNISGQQASAGANVGQFLAQNNTNPFGTALSSFGNTALTYAAGRMGPSAAPTFGYGSQVPYFDMSTIPAKR